MDLQVELEPNSLETFLYLHEVTLTIVEQKDADEEAETSIIFRRIQPRITTGKLTYKGRCLTRQVRDLQFEVAEEYKTARHHHQLAEWPEQPNICTFLYDLLRGIRELGVLTSSAEEWRQKFGFVEKKPDEVYTFLQQAREDARVLFGEDYEEFARIENYDEQFVYMVDAASGALPNDF